MCETVAKLAVAAMAREAGGGGSEVIHTLVEARTDLFRYPEHGQRAVCRGASHGGGLGDGGRIALVVLLGLAPADARWQRWWARRL